MLGFASAGAGCVAAYWLMRSPTVPLATEAIAIHVLAAGLARFAVQVAGASSSERDLALVLALVAPGVGPLMTWLLAIHRRDGATQNAHAVFEETQSSAGKDTRPELERELQVVSHAQILQHGSLEEKRNLLRQLARIGERRYLLLVRRFLRDDEPELRLCAYAELARSCRQREQEIRDLRQHARSLADADPAVLAEAGAELADAHRRYAASGLLDEDMAKYWLDQARKQAEVTLESAPYNQAAQRVLALVLADEGCLDRAWEIAATWPTDTTHDNDLARAELAFRRRDRATCVAVAQRLTAAAIELPPWLAAVSGARPATPRPLEEVGS